MSKTKIVIALVAITALTLVIVGLASAQIAPNPTYAGANPSTAVPNDGFLGWMENCFGLRNSQPYANQNIAPQVPPITGSVPAPNQNGYGYGCGYGPCWAR
jgi:hypothetical protein